MKWLLVTTNLRPYQPNTNHPNGAGWNVGDVFAFLGTSDLIRAVDTKADIVTVNMDDAASITTPQTFDRAVFAGRPMFWRGAERHPLWTNLINGWLCADPRKVMALGVGDCWPLNDPDHFDEWEAQTKAAAAKMYAVHIRTAAVHHTIEGVCPATWLLPTRFEQRPEQTLKLANFMPGGAHYPDFDRRGSELWRASQPMYAGALRELGFAFVAHTEQERTLAQMLGWSHGDIFLFDNPDSYLELYARAHTYVGNRVHGGLVLCGLPAAVTVIGNDTRLNAVRQAGGHALEFRDVSLRFLESCAKRSHYLRGMEETREQRNRQHMLAAYRLLQDFAS